MRCRSTLLRLALVAALSAAVPLARGDTTPEQIHLAYAGVDADGNANGMTVSWTTMSGDTPTSTVKYGLSPSALTMTATGSSVQYLAVR